MLVLALGLLASLVITLPTDVLAEQVTRKYGLSTEAWSLWLRDRSINWLLMSLALVAIASV